MVTNGRIFYEYVLPLPVEHLAKKNFKNVFYCTNSCALKLQGDLSGSKRQFELIWWLKTPKNTLLDKMFQNPTQLLNTILHNMPNECYRLEAQ